MASPVSSPLLTSAAQILGQAASPQTRSSPPPKSSNNSPPFPLLLPRAATAFDSLDQMMRNSQRILAPQGTLQQSNRIPNTDKKELNVKYSPASQQQAKNTNQSVSAQDKRANSLKKVSRLLGETLVYSGNRHLVMSKK